MIKANELRIGNWISNGEKNFTVDGNVMYDADSIDPFCEFLEPIPLTHEILEAAGFKESDNPEYGGWLSPFVEDEAIRIRKDGSGRFWYAPQKYARPVYIDGLHQLQNLYFALTGTELEVKL